jgi:hypothetical protein
MGKIHTPLLTLVENFQLSEELEVRHVEVIGLKKKLLWGRRIWIREVLKGYLYFFKSLALMFYNSKLESSANLRLNLVSFSINSLVSANINFKGIFP